MNRFVVAMGTYAVVAAIAWMKLRAPIPGSEYQVRHLVVVVMAALALSTWVHRRDRRDASLDSSKDDFESGSGQ
jgi:hypothetical protein